MTNSELVTLELATKNDAVLVSNLVELYIHDVCDIFPSVELGADGRFGYPKLPLYWSEPAARFAYLIKRSDRVAGFVFATRGSPVTPDPEVMDVAEFFVLRKYRRAGIGRHAARLLWQALPGKWTVRVSEGNAGALAFWRGVVGEFAGGAVEEDTRPGKPNAWRVLAFQSAR